MHSVSSLLIDPITFGKSPKLEAILAAYGNLLPSIFCKAPTSAPSDVDT